MAISTTAEARIVGKFADKVSKPAKNAFEKIRRAGAAAFRAVRERALALVAGITALVVATSKFIGAANQQEDAVRKLNATLQSTGQLTQGYSKDLQNLAAGFQKVTTFGDETILSLQSQLIAFGATRDNIKEVIQAALDLSAGLGVDLRSSALLLGKALAGEFSTLSRYGIFVDEAADKTDKMKQALEQIQQRFGGQAQAQAETFSGKIKQMSNAFGDLLEQIGFLVTKNQFFQDMMETLKNLFINLGEAIERNRGTLNNYINLFGSVFIAALKLARLVLAPVVFLLEKLAKAFVFLTDLVGITNSRMDEQAQKMRQTREQAAQLSGTAGDLNEKTEAVNRATGNLAQAQAAAASGMGQTQSAAKNLGSAYDSLAAKANKAAAASARAAGVGRAVAVSARRSSGAGGPPFDASFEFGTSFRPSSGDSFNLPFDTSFEFGRSGGGGPGVQVGDVNFNVSGGIDGSPQQARKFGRMVIDEIARANERGGTPTFTDRNI